MSYRKPSVTADGLLIEDNQIVLIKRKHDPFIGQWALPGGFVEYGEKTEDTVIREFREETGLETTIVGLVGVYSDPQRDPRGHTITVAYQLEKIGGTLQAGDDAAVVKFFKIDSLPELSFDHAIIVKDALRR